jgi:hypothetical protein
LLVNVPTASSRRGNSLQNLLYLALQHLELAAMPLVFERIRRIFTMSSHLTGTDIETESILYMLDLIEYALLLGHETQCAKL